MPDFQTTPELSPERGSMSIDPVSSSVAELRQAMADGGLTATALTRHFLERIEELNPALHAVITVNHDAVAEAAASDDAWESGQPRGPLEGIPVLVKDNVQVAGMPTTAGLAGAAAGVPAGCLHRLPAARGGRGDPGEGEPVGVGELPVDPLEQRLVVSRRAGQQPVRARQEPATMPASKAIASGRGRTRPIPRGNAPSPWAAASPRSGTASTTARASPSRSRETSTERTMPRGTFARGAEVSSEAWAEASKPVIVYAGSSRPRANSRRASRSPARRRRRPGRCSWRTSPAATGRGAGRTQSSAAVSGRDDQRSSSR